MPSFVMDTIFNVYHKARSADNRLSPAKNAADNNLLSAAKSAAARSADNRLSPAKYAADSRLSAAKMLLTTSYIFFSNISVGL